MSSRIRNIAVGLVVRDGWVLAEEHAVIPCHHRFVRAIGGGIEFGERAEEALRREFRAELGVELCGAELLAVTENLFQLAGAPGHEIVHVFRRPLPPNWSNCRSAPRVRCSTTTPLPGGTGSASWPRAILRSIRTASPRSR